MNSAGPPSSKPSSSSANPTQAAKPWEQAKSGHGSGTDPLAARFVASLDYDQRLYKHDIRGSLAHARMLRQVGLISSDDLTQIERGLSEIREEIESAGPAWPGWKIQLEDVHMCIEAALIEKVGGAGRKLHTGRSRNDQVALDLLLWIQESVEELKGLFDGLIKAFIQLARRDGRGIMPAYTHLQRAQPIVLGAELLAWVTAFDRARRRFVVLRDINAFNPLGCGAVAGSSLPLDRRHTADSLTVGPPAWNSIDATANRDAAIDFVYGLAMTAMTLSRWAEQWILYCTTEFGFLTLDSRYTTGSSMMPQKANPDMLELIRGRCGGVYGQLVALLTMCKGLPIAYNRDLQEDKRYVFQAYDSVCDCLRLAQPMVETARFNLGKIEKTLGEGFLDATSLAEYLVAKGMAFRTAHQVVGSLVRLCQTKGLPGLAQLPLEEINIACRSGGAQGDLCGAEVYDWLDPEGVVQRYASLGNSGITGFEHQLSHWEDQLSDKR